MTSLPFSFDMDPVDPQSLAARAPASANGETGPGGAGGGRGRPLRYFVYCRKSTESEERQVQSIQSQRDELRRIFGASEEVVLVQVYEEARSAKSPGRPVFSEMMARLEAGEADGLMAWAPDRLARNAIDGGRIIHLLDLGVLRDLKFATCTFENNSQGKFMLQIMFGQSKYYSDALSENVKRGNRTKASKGWRPGSAPVGYLNDPVSKTIVADPVYFPLVRRMFDLVLTGGYSAKQIARIAREEWQITTPRRRRGGGTVHHSIVHRILTNPFYAGLFTWEGQLVIGEHAPVVSREEFKAVQRSIRRASQQHPKQRDFPFVGLIRCGECGMSITARVVTNRYGVRYTYYHCTKKALAQRCRQPAIRAEILESQIAAWLASLTPTSPAAASLAKSLADLRLHAAATASAVRTSVETALRKTQSQLRELLQMRLARLVDDEEYARLRDDLTAEAEKLARRLDDLARPDDRLKPFVDAEPLSLHAADWFRRGDDRLKRTIVKATGLNLTLTDKKLSVEAAKWLRLILDLRTHPVGLGECAGVETFPALELAELVEAVHSDPTAQAQLIAAAQIVERMSAVGDTDKTAPETSPTSPRSPMSRRRPSARRAVPSRAGRGRSAGGASVPASAG